MFTGVIGASPVANTVGFGVIAPDGSGGAKYWGSAMPLLLAARRGVASLESSEGATAKHISNYDGINIRPCREPESDF